MTSEWNKADVPNEPLSIEQPSSSGAKRKRGRPRKYEYTVYELPQRVQPIHSVPLLHSTLDDSNIRHDGVQVNHTSVGSVESKMRAIQVLPAQQTQGNRSSRPRDSSNLVKTSENQTSKYSSAHVQGNSGKDVIIGKHFVGKMSKKCPGFSLITVKVKDNQVLKGWVPDENNLRPITPKDDLAPELPMLRPSQVRKRASAIYRQGDPPMPVHLEDVTLAKPLQMRRPVEESISKHTIPPAPRPYMGSGVVAAAPVSVSSGNAESKILPKQDIESVSPEPSAAAVPVKSAQPVLISCKQVANQDVPVEGKSVTEVHKDSESSNGSKESSGQVQKLVNPACSNLISFNSNYINARSLLLCMKAEKLNTALVDVIVKESPGERKLLNVPRMGAAKESAGQIQRDPTVTDEIKIASGPNEQSNSANSKQQIFMEPSDNKEQSEQPKTETDILKGAYGPKSGASDDVQSVHDEHEMNVDNK